MSKYTREEVKREYRKLKIDLLTIYAYYLRKVGLKKYAGKIENKIWKLALEG